MDSPGHSAQYCTITFMENETNTILCIIIMDIIMRMTGGKSSVLEMACFKKRSAVSFRKRSTGC